MILLHFFGPKKCNDFKDLHNLKIRDFANLETLQNCNEKDVDFWAGIPYIISMIKKGNHMEFIEKHLLWALFSGWTFVLGMAIGAMA